jgi:hypothetical protein
MPAIAATLVRRQKRMRICLQARQHTLRLRSNLRCPVTIPTEADTCRKLALPKFQAARWDDEPYSTAAQAGKPDGDPCDLLRHLTFNAPVLTRRKGVNRVKRRHSRPRQRIQIARGLRVQRPRRPQTSLLMRGGGGLSELNRKDAETLFISRQP